MRSNHRGSEAVKNGIGVSAGAIISVLLVSIFPAVAAQTESNTGSTGNNPYADAKLTPSMAIIIVVLIAAMFFMGFFSIYIRNCTEGSGGGSIRAMVGAGRSRRARGLDAEALQAMPTFAYAEVKMQKIGKGALECAVCLNEFDDDDTLRLLPKCDHVFHADCIDAWLASHTTCPVCRSNLLPADAEADAGEARGGAEVQPGAADQPNDAVVQLPGEPQGEAPTVQPARTWSMKKPRFLSRFPRSHSTGHSLVQPGENCDRFTLRLPENLRKDLMKRSLTRASTFALPREASSRRGYRASVEGSSRGKSHRRLESDRWQFLMAAPFFSRGLSFKSPKVADDGAGTSAAGAPRAFTTTVKSPVGTKGDGAAAVAPEAETARLPV